MYDNALLQSVFGIAIMILRQERGLSRFTAAGKANVSVPQWYKLESGMCWPTKNSLYAVCEALDVNPSEIFFVAADVLSSYECNNQP